MALDLHDVVNGGANMSDTLGLQPLVISTLGQYRCTFAMKAYEPKNLAKTSKMLQPLKGIVTCAAN